jgi:hypothetical protein
MTPRLAFLGLLLSLFGVSCGGRSVAQGTADGGQFGQPGQPDQPGQPPSPAPTPTATCDSACAAMVKMCPTYTQNCASECAMARAEATGCTAQFDAMLACLQSYGIVCDASGNAQPAQACTAAMHAVSTCGGGDTTSPTPRPTPAPPPTIVPPSPPALCPGMPAMPQGLACAGSGSVGSGGGGGTVNSMDCSDPYGNLWQSQCWGPSCTCLYNGTMYCQCTESTVSAYTSCCPGMAP